MLNKQRLIETLERQVNEGYDIFDKMVVSDSNYTSTIYALVDADKTADQLKQEIKFDEAQALINNEDVVLGEEK